MIKPYWMTKHPCSNCRSGYGECAQGLRLNMKCCTRCEHPTRWTSNPPYTIADYREMEVSAR